MKKNALVFLMLLTGLSLYSQNWAPINTTEKFCYETEDVGMISHVIWVDSTQIFNDYEAYYLNKIVAPCDTCTEPDYYLLNQPQFLLHQVNVFNNGDWVFKDGDLELKILPHAHLGDIWRFDDNLNIDAWIGEEDMAYIFGELDSIKIIYTLDYSPITISKNYGIIRWMNEYELIGIEGRNLGTIVPIFENMFSSIDVGDFVYYYAYQADYDEEMTCWETKTKYEILNINKYSDSVVIDVNFDRKIYWNCSSWGSYSFGQETLRYYPNGITEAYPNQAIEWSGNNEETSYLICKMKEHVWGGVMKSQIIVNAYTELTLFVENDNSPFLLNPEDVNSGPNEWYVLYEYTSEYGFLEHEREGFEWNYKNEISGIIDNGDTLGTIYSDEIFTQINESFSMNGIIIYPSPTKEKLHLKTDKTGLVTWSIFDISGRLIQTGSEDRRGEDLVIRVGNLPKGVFILQVVINEQIIRKKFIKE